MEHAPKTAAQEENNWDLEQAVRETEKYCSTDLQLLMTETTNEPDSMKTLICLERQRPDTGEISDTQKMLSSRIYLGFIEDKIIVPKNLPMTIFSLLQKNQPAINKMTLAARHLLWPRMTEAKQEKGETSLLCRMSGKVIRPNVPNTETNSFTLLNGPNEETQLEFIGPITENNLSLHRFS